MDYKKLGILLIAGLVGTICMSITFDYDIPKLTDTLIFVEIIEVIMWCFLGKEK